MTTTITVKTHSWPVRVTINDNHDFRDEASGTYRYGHSTESSVVPKQSEQSFHITNIRQISFAELPEDWTPESDSPRGGMLGQAIAGSANVARGKSN